MTPTLHKCASPICPGLPWAASDHRHPCDGSIRVRVTSDEGTYVSTLQEMVDANDPGSIDEPVRWAVQALPGQERRFPGNQTESYLWEVVDEFTESGLSVRACNVLHNAGIRTTAQVRSRSDNEILRLKNAGRRVLDELRAYGLRPDSCVATQIVPGPGCQLPAGHPGECVPFRSPFARDVIHRWTTAPKPAPAPAAAPTTRDLILIDQRTGPHVVGPYATPPDGSLVVLHRDPLPAAVRVAWEALNNVHRAVGPVLRAHFNAERIVLDTTTK